MGRFLAFGEILLRLSPPGRELLLQTPTLSTWVGGAEANVAAALARLGHDVGFVSRVPDNDLGRAATATLRGHGIDTAMIQRGGERIGLYFVTRGAGLRATEVLYDRAGSAFAEAPAEAWDWDAILAGASRLHLSGITPALGAIPARSAIAAARAASERGIPLSFDGNWRGKLWERWDCDPRAILRQIVEHADLMFGNHRDIALLLDRRFDTGTEERRREAAEAAFEAFPNLSMIASTARHVDHVDRHLLSARIDMRCVHIQTEEVAIAGIVDRIGAGDAFAAGILHGLLDGDDLESVVRSGLALACLKHSLPGDASIFTRHDIDAFHGGELDVRR